MLSTTNTADGGNTHQATSGRLLLSSPDDDELLSDLFCLLRAQLEVFAANEADVEARGTFNGIPVISVGRVGIRCVHCCHLPHDERARGAVSYPNSIRIMNQAVRNWQRYHFLACELIPDRVKDKYQSIKGKRVHSSKTSMQYWIESCENMGMVDTEDEGIRFKYDVAIGGGHEVVGRVSSESEQEEFEEGDRDFATNGGLLEHDKKHNRKVMTTEHQDASLKPSATGTGDLDQVDLDLEADIESWVDNVILQMQEGDEAHSNLSNSNIVVAHCSPNEKVPASSVGTDSSNPNYVVARSSLHEEIPASGIETEVPSTSKPMDASECNLDSAQQEVVNDLLVQRIALAHELVKTSREMREITSSTGATENGNDVQSDLSSLGVELYELFVDRHPIDSGRDGTIQESYLSVGGLPSDDLPDRKRGKRRANKPYTPLVEWGLPTPLCNLVSSLLDSCNDDGVQRYQSVLEVEEDLLQMSINPKRFLFEPDVETISRQLDFTGDRVFGQEANVAKVMHAYDRAITPGGESELVLISGHSGTGKSSLVRQVQGPLVDRGACFISGKFDEMRQVQPLSAIVDAFNKYCGILLTKDEESISSIRASIKEAVGEDGKVLTNLIPRLHEIIGQPEDSSVTLGAKEAQNRLMFFFRKFLRTISSPLHPVVFFLDDLQWADEASLELISAFVMDKEINSLLFLACYRDNEVGSDHPLNMQLGTIIVSGVSLTVIKTENMHKETVNVLVSDALHLSPRLTEPLASIVFHKTNGNGLFVVQFLKSLCDEGLLHFSLVSRQWDWDLDAIKAKAVADSSVIELIKDKMLKLASGPQRGLTVAACLGAQCDETTLRFLGGDGFGDHNGIAHLLDVAVDEGLMFKVGTTYTFAHDAVQSAAYSLIPKSERNLMHLQIGRSLLKRETEEELDSILFVAVDQIYRGSDLINDDGKIEAVQFFLRAGEKAISMSAFLPASIYLLQGIEFLGDDDWTNHYDLSVQLYSACAETYYVTGNFDGLAIVSNPLLEHARCLGDKLRVYKTLASSLAAEGKLLDAIKFGLHVLEQLGESFPGEVDQSVIMRYLVETNGMLHGTSTDAILNKNTMQDENKLAAMQFLSLMSFYSYFCQPQLYPVTTSRMVQLSLSHGVCKESAFAFGAFAVVLCKSVEDARQSYIVGKLALSLVERFKARELVSRVWVCVYGQVNIFFEPVQACIDSLKFAHEVGMSTGDVDWAVLNAHAISVSALQCGRRLEPLADELESYLLQMKELNQLVVYHMAATNQQAVLNLLGSSEEDDPTNMISTEHGDLLVEAIETQNWIFVSYIYFLRMWLAYLFRRYELAAEMAENRRRTATLQRPGTLVNETFYTALTALASAKDGERSKSRSVAHDAAEKMKAWAENSKWNFQHKLEMLKAEIAFVDGDMEEAARAYDDAIHLAGEHGFVNEQALACERAGIFYSSAAHPLIADEYFSRAHKYYLEWGAKRKAMDLLNHMGNTN